jgi:hypothetical protein
VRTKPGTTHAKKKYPVNSYLDSLIRNTRLVEICEITSEPEMSYENGNTTYRLSLQKDTNLKTYTFAVGGNYPFTPFSTHARYIATKSDHTTARLFKKGDKLIFFVNAIESTGTPLSTKFLEIIGFVKPTKKNIYYLQHTFRETKSNVTLSLYHTGKKPRKDKNHFTRKERYWIYYENGTIQRESIRLNKRSIMRIKNEKGKKRFKFFYLTRKDTRNYYYENGTPKEKIEKTYKIEKVTGDQINSFDTTKFDATGKIIYRNQQILRLDHKNTF